MRPLKRQSREAIHTSVATHATVYELEDRLAIMGNMIWPKHLVDTWPNTHLLRGLSSKSKSGMQ